MVAAIVYTSEHLLEASFFMGTAIMGSALILYPRRILEYFELTDTTDWEQFLVQLIGQILLSITVIPVMYLYLQFVVLA